MKIMQIQYTAKDDFVQRNKENIAKVMADLRALSPVGFRYASFLKEDGKTFVHLVIFNDEANEVLGDLKAFQTFRAELDAKGFEIEPVVMNLSLVGSSTDLL